MPQKIQNARLTAGLQRLLDLKGRYLPLIDEIVVPVVIAGTIDPDEDITGLSPASAEGGIRQAAAAGFVSQAQIFNPATSTKLVNVTRLHIHSSAAGLVHVGPVVATVLFSGTTQWQDRRQPVASQPTSQMRRNANIAAPTLVSPLILGVDGVSSLEVPVDFWLPPGNGVEVATVTQNVDLNLGVQFTEQPNV